MSWCCRSSDGIGPRSAGSSALRDEGRQQDLLFPRVVVAPGVEPEEREVGRGVLRPCAPARRGRPRRPGASRAPARSARARAAGRPVAARGHVSVPAADAQSRRAAAGVAATSSTRSRRAVDGGARGASSPGVSRGGPMTAFRQPTRRQFLKLAGARRRHQRARPYERRAAARSRRSPSRRRPHPHRAAGRRQAWARATRRRRSRCRASSWWPRPTSTTAASTSAARSSARTSRRRATTARSSARRDVDAVIVAQPRPLARADRRSTPWRRARTSTARSR